MTGRPGITRSLIFPPASAPIVNAPAPREKQKTKDKEAEVADPPETRNVVISFGDLVRDNRTIQEKLEHLLGDPDHFGGNCRVILNLLRHMQRNCEKLIVHNEEV
jgi:hypothetical protein